MPPSLDNPAIPLDNSMLRPGDYLKLGAVWFLPAEAPRDPKHGVKPKRLSIDSLETELKEGDYLRIHHTPRRFLDVYKYNWIQNVNDNGDELPGVIVARNDTAGYLVIDKPAHMPVHPTVDNQMENVASMIESARLHAGEEEVYVSTPQRLDQNTSGLLVVATKKTFATYYARLLQRKTSQQLSNSTSTEAIHKRYKCLLCLMRPSSDTVWSVATALQHLQSYVNNGRVMRHYLEPSLRAPKHFAATPGNDTWAECLLRIKSVTHMCPLVGSPAGQKLALSLWTNPDAIPIDCVAVVQVEVELLTGRTHQIRGQFAAEGFPLVGDAQYGGALCDTDRRYIHSDNLALQCCQLEFLDPDENEDEEELVPSDRWNTFRRDECWWTQLLDEYDASDERGVTTSMRDIEQALKVQEGGMTEDADSSIASTVEFEVADLLPPQVSLSRGSHKYVLIKTTKPEEHWFVKSASPYECGGPYHANVAQDVVEWLEAAGYNAVVTGGGRIDFSDGHAHVYGFSFGFGKGNHEKAASLIVQDGMLTATFDNSDGLY